MLVGRDKLNRPWKWRIVLVQEAGWGGGLWVENFTLLVKNTATFLPPGLYVYTGFLKTMIQH